MHWSGEPTSESEEPEEEEEEEEDEESLELSEAMPVDSCRSTLSAKAARWGRSCFRILDGHTGSPFLRVKLWSMPASCFHNLP